MQLCVRARRPSRAPSEGRCVLRSRTSADDTLFRLAASPSSLRRAPLLACTSPDSDPPCSSRHHDGGGQHGARSAWRRQVRRLIWAACRLRRPPRRAPGCYPLPARQHHPPPPPRARPTRVLAPVPGSRVDPVRLPLTLLACTSTGGGHSHRLRLSGMQCSQRCWRRSCCWQRPDRARPRRRRQQRPATGACAPRDGCRCRVLTFSLQFLPPAPRPAPLAPWRASRPRCCALTPPA